MIVDDAHVDPDRLVRLAQIRREISADFSIVTTVWPGDKDKVAEKLGIGCAPIRELPRLKRRQIVSIIHSAGLLGPSELIGEIVDQASGLP
ncbi:hypothetical protein [Paludisphaera soli]|uniref:hypothetical protein n=1 Tax=Paludisphaera soli TaxID=2712865 RepID=UPI0013EC999B|nr:hypothetical protein [Paludisphaera soli]